MNAPDHILREATPREALLHEILAHGLLYRSETQPILSRDGSSGAWMLDSLQVSMTARGSALAASVLLPLLERFESTQIVTYGLTAVPLLQACVAHGNGRFRGLLLRKERKAHGSRKLIEGRLDPDEPVVVVDDSISSGTTMREACEKLEAMGLRVEGGVFLVRFGWYGGYGLMQEKGYHLEYAYDIWDDVIANMPDEQSPLPNPSKWFPSAPQSLQRAPEGLHPADLARLVMSEYLRSGCILTPPRALDRDYDSAGGAWVSIRERERVHMRHARDGFWHFPGEERWATPEAVVRAAVRTACHLPRTDAGHRLLDRCAVAVTFFGELEACAVGELDNDRYGIVVRSNERPAKMGGALPRMPGIRNEWMQFHHARVNNAQLVSFEPYTIYRHDVHKMVEPGSDWQTTGVPGESPAHACESAELGGRLARYALDLVLARMAAASDPDEVQIALTAEAGEVHAYVTVFFDGRVRGCAGCRLSSPARDLRALVAASLEDERFEDRGCAAGRVAVSVSFLYRPLVLGRMSEHEVAGRFRFTEQALMAIDGERSGMLLPWFAVRANWSEAEYIHAVREKAAVASDEPTWKRFDTKSWTADAAGAVELSAGFRRHPTDERPATARLEELVGLCAGYLARNQLEDGRFMLHYLAAENVLRGRAGIARDCHAGWVLVRAARELGGDVLRTSADRAVATMGSMLRRDADGTWLASDDGRPAIAEIAFTLLALSGLDVDHPLRAHARELATTLWNCVDRHGRLRTHKAREHDADAYQDFYPGEAMLALGRACRAGIAQPDERVLERIRSYYLHRCRHRHHLGQTSWWIQAAAEWAAVTGDTRWSDFAFEIAARMPGLQSAASGGFLTDFQPDSPGATTAFFLEGLGAAAGLARAAGEDKLHSTYASAWDRGVRFLDRLVYHERDASLLPNPAFAVGGLRSSLVCSEVRIDFVQHFLSTLLDHPNRG